MLVAAAVCPHPPVLVPEAMGQAGRPRAGTGEVAGPDPDVTAASPPGRVDAQLRVVRQVCIEAVGALAAARPTVIIIVGTGESTRYHPASSAGTLRGFGIPFDVGVGAPVLPLSLTIGVWLAEVSLPVGTSPRTGSARRIELLEVDRDAPVRECLRLGERLAGRARRVGLLALGDGTARRALGTPGGVDPAADSFDAAVAAALAEADVGALARIGADSAKRMRADGRSAWQVLAGAAGATGARGTRSGSEAGGGGLRGRLLYAGAPLDVAYFVASWTS